MQLAADGPEVISPHGCIHLDARLSLPHFQFVVDAKKNTPQYRPIRLKPSTSDYATFARTTAKTLGLTGPAAYRTKPNEYVLWLANLGS